MRNNTETKIWNATLYLRLSRDDGDKEESNSITGQRELLRDFIRTRPELREYAVRIDDGFTGSNFDRPSFKKMLEDVKAGCTNCIIVKDLSRFGQNYLDAGEYIEKIFLFLGVRFIAVNDNYDSFGGKNASDELVIPFKNLINEAYCRDISVKVRTQLDVKRKSGQYIDAFAVYGYLKDEADKNHLIVDEYAADIVRDIFSWKLEGMSPQDIASRLNHNGVSWEHGLLDYEELEARAAAATERYHTLSAQIKAEEGRMAEIVVLKTHIANYAKTRNVYTAYRKAGYSKKYLAEHEGDILLHKAAKKAFDELGVKKLPSVKSLQEEYAKLLSEKKAAYAKYRRSRDEMRELLLHKQNVDRMLGKNEREEEKKKEHDRQ